MGTLLGCVVALLGLLAGLGSGTAGAAGHKKLVEGTVYDTTCASGCEFECPPPPHCGPITAEARTDVVCAQRRIVACPLSEAASARVVCVQAEGCPGTNYPVYSGEGAVVNVRKRGSATVLAQLPVTEGHFEVRLGPGEYVLRTILGEPQCWTGGPGRVKVTAKTKGPIPASLEVSDSCVAHPDSE